MKPVNKADIPTALEIAPIQAFIPICGNWAVDPVIQACNGQIEHGVMLYGLDSNGNYIIRDTYPPYDKVLAKDYPLNSNYQYIVSLPNPVQEQIWIIKVIISLYQK